MTPEQLANRVESRYELHHTERSQIAAELRRLAVENEALRAESMRFRADAMNEKAARKAIEAALAERQGEAVPSAQITAEIGCVLSDPKTKLSAGAKRALQWVLTWTSEPLYTHPAPAQQPPTDEQIQDLLGIGNPTEEECRLIRLGWNAAHGIGGEK